MISVYRSRGYPGLQSRAYLGDISQVRRELADNFCLYQPNYDSLKGAAISAHLGSSRLISAFIGCLAHISADLITGAAGWAYDSLQLHNADARDHVYTLEQLEGAGTHEDLWNAAQNQLVNTGKMHGFMCAISQ